MKALEDIIAGTKCQLGTKLAHLESIIRHLVTELGWRENQPSPLNEGDEPMEMANSMHQSSRSELDHSDAQNVTRDSSQNEEQTTPAERNSSDDTPQPGEFTQLIQETELFFDKLEKPDKIDKDSANNETKDPNPEIIDIDDSIAITASQAEALREENNPEKTRPRKCLETIRMLSLQKEI